MVEKENLATFEQLVDARYQSLTKPWYKDFKQFISVVGVLAAIVTSFASLYISMQGQTKAVKAVQIASDLGHDISIISSKVAQPLSDIFVYTSTFFSGQKEAAIKDAIKTRRLLKSAGIVYDVNVFERADKNRWAVVIGNPKSKKEANQVIKLLKEKINLSGYPNPSEGWNKIEI